MLEKLIDTLPELRQPLLFRELQLLQSSITRNFPDIEDQTLATHGDPQGLGGRDA
jgi:hypothetical protein